MKTLYRKISHLADYFFNYRWSIWLPLLAISTILVTYLIIEIFKVNDSFPEAVSVYSHTSSTIIGVCLALYVARFLSFTFRKLTKSCCIHDL